MQAISIKQNGVDLQSLITLLSKIYGVRQKETELLMLMIQAQQKKGVITTEPFRLGKAELATHNQTRKQSITENTLNLAKSRALKAGLIQKAKPFGFITFQHQLVSEKFKISIQ